ncbi:MAG: acyl-CoA synthetase (AMP-forming)/AMP-acid ligase II [Kiritimatiellia bacterium]
MGVRLALVEPLTGQHAARYLRAHALAAPDRPALIYPVGQKTRWPVMFGQMSFAQVEARTDQLAHGLWSIGVRKGVKTVLMIKPTEELFIVLLALFKVGAVPVVVDPGMGLSRMLHCYGSVGAEAMVGLPLAHAVRMLRPRFFESVRINVTNGALGGRSLADLYLKGRGVFELPEMSALDLMMITFTTGSTGPAKGVEYTHGMIDALSRQMLAAFPVQDGEIGLVTLPLFAVVDLFTGCTAVLAPMDPTRPANVDPDVIIGTIERYGVRHLFASPALLTRVAPHLGARAHDLSSLATVVCGGAAGSIDVLQTVRAFMPTVSALHTTYGATEALPICTITLAELADGCIERTHAGQGVCVGRAVDQLVVSVIGIDAQPIEVWSDDLLVQGGVIGEVVLRGALVSARYHRDEVSNVLHKIMGDDGVYHRTGDVGWLDEQGRLWLCGRKAHIVITKKGPLYTLPCEGVFNAHPAVQRSALVGVGPEGAQIPVMCVQLRTGFTLHDALRAELLALANVHAASQGVDHVIEHPSFPVDIRHNAKIDRPHLAVWAGARLGLIRTRGASVWPMLVPIVGWLFLLVGLIVPLPYLLLQIAWWVVLFLHLVVHPLEIFASLAPARRVGHSTGFIALMTTIFGVTYWHPLVDVTVEELR